MKVRNIYPKSGDEGTVIASFGQAKLIKFLNGRYELRDGSKEDRFAAHEWISMFCHDVVVKEVP
jgi:hypothetical protein